MAPGTKSKREHMGLKETFWKKVWNVGSVRVGNVYGSEGEEVKISLGFGRKAVQNGRGYGERGERGL